MRVVDGSTITGDCVSWNFIFDSKYDCHCLPHPCSRQCETILMSPHHKKFLFEQSRNFRRLAIEESYEVVRPPPTPRSRIVIPGLRYSSNNNRSQGVR
jgi:hypothetical protein